MILFIGISVPELHPVARACNRIRFWTKPAPEDGPKSAAAIILMAWIVYAFAVAIAGDPSTPAGNAQCWFLLGAPDALLRMWRIQTSLFFVPVCLIGPAIGLMILYT